jgi:hypothetical protein
MRSEGYKEHREQSCDEGRNRRMETGKSEGMATKTKK